LLVAGAAALAYGVGAQLVFQQASDVLVGTLSISFLVLVPIALGALTVALAPAAFKRSWAFAVFVPWAICALVGLIAFLLALELWLCIVMGLPLFFVLSSLGGVLVCYLYKRKDAPNSQNTTLGLLLLAPFLFLPLEAQLGASGQERTVQTQIEIAADPTTVWASFVVVPEIQPAEERFAWFRLLGLPDPVEATLTGQGVGGMRLARYANGLHVVEPVLVWEPPLRYRFAVEVDPASLPSPLWRAVEGRHLDVQSVEYEVESHPDGGVLLHLESVYRLATPLNPYAGFWMDFLLDDFQHYILAIVKQRAEHAQSQLAPGEGEIDGAAN
jgi:hypothetical protein